VKHFGVVTVVKAREADFFEWLVSQNQEIQTVFDVGAHIGHWSAQLAKKFPKADYHLFEPRLATDPETKNEFEANASNYRHKIVAEGNVLCPGK
jgi:hypothetical protein